ncbi:MAG: hypothetical protein IAE84_13665 [Saprospiraceae bacterium]|nr:hypothetical protein [Saprospiraceae bacterium]
MANTPPEYLLPALLGIETAVLDIRTLSPKMLDKDVEEVYEDLKEFYQQLAQDKDVFEPRSTKSIKQALLSGIIETLDFRIENGLDEVLLDNPACMPGGKYITCEEAAYVQCFNHLLKSVRFWRKENGPTGYLQFISRQVPF